MVKKWSEEQKMLAKKIVIIAFLVMLVIGFTVPAFFDLGDNNEPSQAAPQKNCQADSDCYLMCDDVPVSVLCYQNLCWQNSCEEFALYPFNQTPVSFSLEVGILGEKVDFVSSSNAQDLFVKAENGKVSMYSQLALRQILEKFKVKLEGGCLITNQSYCNGKGGNLSMMVNNEDAYSYGDYVPQEKDVIKVEYS